MDCRWNRRNAPVALWLLVPRQTDMPMFSPACRTFANLTPAIRDTERNIQ
jgi:hypothetical protein